MEQTKSLTILMQNDDQVLNDMLTEAFNIGAASRQPEIDELSKQLVELKSLQNTARRPMFEAWELLLKSMSGK